MITLEMEGHVVRAYEAAGVDCHRVFEVLVYRRADYELTAWQRSRSDVPLDRAGGPYGGDQIVYGSQP